MTLDSLFSNSLERKFDNNLRNIEGKTKFKRLENYFISQKELLNGNISHSSILDTRIKKKSYFYLPEEVDLNELNCFERAVNIYLAAKRLYPSSNPKFLNLDEGKRGIHSMVVLTHKQKLYALDLSYDFFEPVIIYDKKIKSVTNLDKEEKFEEISLISDFSLENQIRNLRKESGIIDFFKGAGQISSFSNTFFNPYSIFMYFNDEGDFVSEIRSLEFSIGLNFCHRRFIDIKKPIKNRVRSLEYSIYRYDSWRNLVGEFILNKSFKIDSTDKFRSENVKYRDFMKGKRMNDMAIYFLYKTSLYLKRKKLKMNKNLVTLYDKSSIQRYINKIDFKKDNFLKFGKSYSDHFLKHLVDYKHYSYFSKINFKKENKKTPKEFVLDIYDRSYVKFLTAYSVQSFFRNGLSFEVIKPIRQIEEEICRQG